jgi:hypothetical protein
MSTSSNQWYVEMSAGITLGPMPFDDVVELAETSAIMRGDRVREESSKEWKSAHEVPGLFADGGSNDSDSGVVSLSGFEVAQASTEARTQEPAKSEEPAPTPEVTDGVVRLGEFEVLLGVSETAAENADDPASALLRAASSLETVEPTAVAPRKVEPVKKREPEQRAVAKPVPSLVSPDDGIPALDIPSEIPPSSSPALAPPSHTLDLRETAAVANDARTSEPDTREARAPLDLATLVSAGVEDGPAPAPPVPAAAPPPFKPPFKPWRPPVKLRNKQLVVRGSFALAAVAGVWGLFSLLKSDMEVATYDQYAAIYLEYESLTESPDSGSWTEFATRAKAELDETLPQLEAVAVPGEHSKSLLLYAGRDLRTALDLTPEATNPHAERLAGFFEQLNALHASTD